MSSTQVDDFPPSGPSMDYLVESDADLSLYGDHSADSPRSERRELNVEEIREQGLIHGGTGYTADSTRDRQIRSFASKLTALVQGIIEQTRNTMERALTNVNEIDFSLADVMAEFQNAGGHGKCRLEEDRHKVHQAACKVLEILDVTSSVINVSIVRLDILNSKIARQLLNRDT